LVPQDGDEHDPQNLHDGKFGSAWVEGSPGDGVGEYVEYALDQTEKKRPPGREPALLGLSFLNGYTRSPAIWKAYSRAKTLRFRVDGTETYLIELRDTLEPQIVTFDPIPIRSGRKTLLRFEIVATYRGEQHSDVAITELKLNGRSPH